MSYFYLELDTTKPTIDIIAPDYTIPNINTEIIISANEPLSSYQDIYIIDSEGSRFNLDCLLEGDRFIYNGYLNQLSLGMATIYARVKDEVENISGIYSKAINILKSDIYNLKTNSFVNSPNTGTLLNKIILESHSTSEGLSIFVANHKVGIMVPNVKTQIYT